MYGDLMYCLRLVKFFHDIGIYEKAVGNIKEISEGDYYELALRGIEHVAPVYDMEELGEEHCCGGHVLHHFSDPAMLEYYRLCRLYEFKHSITPEDNPYVIKADVYYVQCLNGMSGNIITNYEDLKHPRGIWIETCPESYHYEHEYIELVHDLMEFYRSEVETIRAELMKGPPVWLPALPAHIEKPKRQKKPRPTKKAPRRKRVEKQ